MDFSPRSFSQPTPPGAWFTTDAAMRIPRRFTVAGQDPFGAIPFVPRTSRIVNPDGSVVFEMKDFLAPESWSQVATDILAQKYFRRAGLPARPEPVDEPVEQRVLSHEPPERSRRPNEPRGTH